MLNKAITHGKEWRKPYKGTKAVSSSCCNNGGCPYCQSNRRHKNNKRELSVKQKQSEVCSIPLPVETKREKG